jgi:AcrR family transcriptional regulator
VLTLAAYHPGMVLRERVVAGLDMQESVHYRDKARPGGWRKAEIIDVAALCFMERGYHATSIDDVARRLGCTKGRIYHHYASKTDLFFDVHREGMARLFAALEPALRTGGNGLQVLRAMLMAHALAMLEHHTYENVVAQGVQVHRFGATTPEQRETMAELIASRDRFEGHFKDTITAAIADGSIRAVDVSITSKVLLGALQWSIIWYRPKPEDDAASRAALANKMLMPLIEGLRPRNDEPPPFS